MAPHHEVAAAGPARRLSGQGKTRQTESARTQALPSMRLSECTVGVVQSVCSDMAGVAAKGGTFWRLFRPQTPQGGLIRPALPIIRTSPHTSPVQCDRWRSGDGWRRCPVDQLSRPRVLVSLHSMWRTLDAQVSVAGRPPVWGTSHIPNGQLPGYTPAATPLPGAAYAPS
ncbi:hypothetical protein GWK47_051435 [Chionoecetes opilio]|uniref:Uncharacterized protein n=1 Tax=Chionoecetes opilio TaxID=41210 RepID=A0A8J4Y295_CHIOP|nr:hypothetical protein GWK47_051435 [Chionoecetes opilio]